MTDELNTGSAAVTAAPGNPYYRPAIERLRLILMFLMCLYLFGFPTVFGAYISKFCGFVPIAFFMLSGYLVLHETEDRSARIRRSIKRTAVVFGVLTLSYLLMSLIYYLSLAKASGAPLGTAFLSGFLPTLLSPRVWFDFLVMNVWELPVGNTIWFVQALLYAYIILYFFDKWNLLRFDWLIAAVLLLFTVCTGELAGVLHFHIAGYTYIPGNFLTRALPYVLLGGFLHKKMRVLNAVKKGWFVLGIFVGIVLMLLEILVLGVLRRTGYYAHLLGMPVIAFSVCMLAFTGEKTPGFEQFLGMSRGHINCIYYLCPPVSTLLAMTFAESGAGLAGLMGIFVFLICFILAWMISHIDKTYIRPDEGEQAGGEQNG